MDSKVELVKGTAFELDPNKKYLLIFDSSTISRYAVDTMQRILHNEMNIKSISCILNGDVNSMQIVEQENG